MNRKIILFLFLLFFSIVSNAEKQPNFLVNGVTLATEDSLKTNQKPVWFPQKIGAKELRPMFVLDIKRSLFSTWKISTYGIRLGFEHKGIQVFNLGYFFLGSPGDPIPSFNLFHPPSQGKKQLNYRGRFSTFYYERTVFRSKKIAFSIPLYLKYGQLYGFESLPSFNKPTPIFKRPFYALASGLQLQYYFLPWLGPKISVGCRLITENNIPIQQSFNGIYFGASVQVLWAKLYYQLKKYSDKRKA